MKKLFTLCCALMLGAMVTNAQVTVKGSKLTDNISVGLAGGVITPTTHHAFFGDMRPVANLTIAKQLTPIFGLAVEGETGFNTNHLTGLYIHTKNVFDVLNVNLLGQINLNNLFAGYKGEPRFFEVVAVLGGGWGRDFRSNCGDNNYFASKAGLNLNFNLGEAKAWQINIKPAITWDLTNSQHWMSYNVNRSALTLLAGVTYKFKNSNGTHNFEIAKLYDQAELDALNAKINDLRAGLNAANNAKAQAEAKANDLQRQLDECRNKAPQVVKEVASTNNLESVVTFAQGKSVITASQYPNVERIATYLKNHANSRVVIKGYASPEGSIEINNRLAKARAEAVKNLLIKKYRISASRIEASGQGVGNMFSEPDWNRVAISTLSE